MDAGEGGAQMTPTARCDVLQVRSGRAVRRRDALAAEEPLEIRVGWPGHPPEPVTVTMRTPGHDFELAAGWLFAEGLVSAPPAAIRYCTDGEQMYNVVSVDLRAPADLTLLKRATVTTAACGVCGKATLDALAGRGLAPLRAGARLDAGTLTALPDRLRQAQAIFARTGGLHAAALFDGRGQPLALREDVGRHNAVDKVVGWALLGGRLPLADAVLVVSGRAGYEIAQKAVAAGVPILASVSAPSSLAVDVARAFGLTLVGFLRGDGFNVYAGAERLDLG
jgi:FdhD protein